MSVQLLQRQDGIDSMIATISASYPILTKEQELAIGRRISAGLSAQQEVDGGAVFTLERRNAIEDGLHAQDELFLHNVRLVPYTIQRMKFLDSPTFDFDDAVSYGFDGLRRAVAKFQAEKGFKFSTYATFWVKQAVMRGRQQAQSTITIPGHIQDGIRSTFLANDENENALSDEQHRVRSLSNSTSLNRAINANDDSPKANPLEYLIADQTTLTDDLQMWTSVRSSMVDVIETALLEVSERNESIWRSHYGFGVEEVTARLRAEEYGISATAAAEAVRKTNLVLREALTEAGFTLDNMCSAA